MRGVVVLARAIASLQWTFMVFAYVADLADSHMASAKQWSSDEDELQRRSAMLCSLLPHPCYRACTFFVQLLIRSRPSFTAEPRSCARSYHIHATVFSCHSLILQRSSQTSQTHSGFPHVLPTGSGFLHTSKKG
mmetsp:Transcript_25752/g.83218  ORF Transcript_25752/g.83218 Transcript_25752/m.83218 type:complete len:134 (+) Transcript_25752:1028-1429(+)